MGQPEVAVRSHLPRDAQLPLARGAELRRATAEFREWDEGMFGIGLRAAAQRLPFLPARAGLGSAVMDNDSTLRTVTSPYDDGEELVAVPALNLDVALVHMNRADCFGNVGRAVE